jgi:hypothetical protein
MKYMDQTITEKEALALHEHLSECEECMEDFKIYDEIMMSFAEAPLETLADDFEDCVMEKIAACGVAYEKRSMAVDSFVTFVIGTVSVLFGLGFMLVVNREQIMNYLMTSALFGDYARAISPMVNVVIEYTQNFINIVSNFAGAAGGLIADYKYVVLTGFVILLVAQYILRKKEDKVEV